MSALWTSDEIVAATGGTLVGAPFEVSGVTFDSREVEPGHLFVAMPGTVHDGHHFVAGAFASGAAGALVSQPVDGPHVLVADVAEALTALAIASRARVDAKVIGVTGSVGKTSTKEALAAALSRGVGVKVHRSVKSYNNHTGVPLSLARMPRDVDYAVLEMGMNNAGEIAALTRLVRPHVAIVNAIASAHIENLGSMEAIADAKGEIFEGLEPDGIAIVPEDSPYRDRLVKKARRHAGRVLTFGSGEADVAAIHAVRADNGGSLVTARLLESELTFTIAQRGEHWVSNALAVLAAVEAVEADLAVAGLALADMGGLKGRGERHQVEIDGGKFLLVDESYNANPASMAATLKSLGEERSVARRIAVLGPMRELGAHSDAAHAGLAPSILDARIDQLILVGDEMIPLVDALGDSVPVTGAANADEAADALVRIVRPGDAVLVKASNSIGLAKLVDRVAGGTVVLDPLPARS
ncbi:UDP-N-acetylmuramoyl-tripeptide--D-alanyl-D-alanine ligase [Sphingomonas rhizophila]|uniref:UDP-N-acetylmuramoyl-tripeptide--D-alanyl-D-alanine ligase n=1 Tax=Sphingomonas rhizophila TaxID=2071607 RepID=A0A7G9S9C7_9SPHN|nr:UDP-N-acetylmuramoyl-tripeptide--D-alanyl-D-alanine ligase [Sphingomonas rhizophila]QNN64452.1 UDP-N-acetylmuramoyl-tripeptide--D-alanyl-D-alanine ligase [Sphingomonas rhizophila]